jgi:hypothetical protein
VPLLAFGVAGVPGGLAAVAGSLGAGFCPAPVQPVSAAPVITTAWKSFDGANFMFMKVPKPAVAEQGLC